MDMGVEVGLAAHRVPPSAVGTRGRLEGGVAGREGAGGGGEGEREQEEVGGTEGDPGTAHRLGADMRQARFTPTHCTRGHRAGPTAPCSKPGSETLTETVQRQWL